MRALASSLLPAIVLVGAAAPAHRDSMRRPVSPVSPVPPAPRTRVYYIAADPADWDYIPGGRDEIEGRPYTDSAFFAGAKPRPVSTV